MRAAGCNEIENRDQSRKETFKKRQSTAKTNALLEHTSEREQQKGGAKARLCVAATGLYFLFLLLVFLAVLIIVEYARLCVLR